MKECQLAFDTWRAQYNDERPHEAFKFASTGCLLQASSRAFTDTLPAIVYDPNDIVRKVDLHGDISFHNRLFHVGKAFQKHFVALRNTGRDHELLVLFCQQLIAILNLAALQ